MPRPHVALLLALAAAYGVSHFPGGLDPYLLDVLTGIGINIILAVSLNLVNGYTGQFSLGHAGFMAVGAYLAAAVTVFGGPHLLGE
ncbi:MAG: branched-chain amino acid ABC transporter permease, partial [Planctomycetia bacterium]|nr:branched-chain amino acid ABC transporter permease [Planctomycetia bacterium]